MAATAIAAWVGRTLGWLPRPVHTLLDRWSQQRAARRRDRRAWLALLRPTR